MRSNAESSGRRTRTRRFVHSNPVPLEEDSDSDFNPGAYVYEVPKKRGRRPGSDAAGKITTRAPKSLEATLDVIASANKHSRNTVQSGAQAQNPLLEYFNDLNLHSASEGENPSDDDEDTDSQDKSSLEGDPDSPPTVSKTMTALIQANKATSQRADTTTESETESDSESVIPSTAQQRAAAKRKAPLSALDAETTVKRPKLQQGDFSETESDSGTGVPPSHPGSSQSGKPIVRRVQRSELSSEAVVGQSRNMVNTDDSGSETEPDTDDNPSELSIQDLQPRPVFTKKPDQHPSKPLVLADNIKVPSTINAFLRDYQREGIHFFWERYKKKMGGLLGDDMGLVCKTIQVISFLSAIMHKCGDIRDLNRRRKHVSKLQDSADWKKRRVLPPANATWPTCFIIAPSSVVGNWQREFETWGYFEVGMLTGTRDVRKEVLNEFKLGRLDVVVTSFETARNDIALLDDLAWSCIIIDEVHRLKNPQSGTAMAFSRFTCTVRFGLTGTAIQNSFSELWTILNWTNPGAVGTKRQWEGFVSKPLNIGQSKKATEEQRTKAILVAQILAKRLLPKFFLRRTKRIIQQQLPKKDDQVVFCPLTPQQIDVYKRILNLEPVQNMIRKDEQCDCGSNKKRRKCCHPFDKGDLFRYLTVLIKISNHLALILPAPSDTPEQTKKSREIAQLAFGAESLPKFGPSMLISKYCGKWLILESLLDDWRKDPLNKVLIFTKSLKLLEMLEYHLNSRNLGFVKLDGSTKPQDRMPMIDRFHEDPSIFVFLISTLAGGTGLNLMGANKVVIFDPNWNPAHDLQAIDRAYRFGQTRDVSVFRLLGAGSIEELIYARQVYKQQQMQVGYVASFQTRYFEGVQGQKDMQGELFGIKNIFKLHEGTLATKKAIERAIVSDFNWALAHVGARKAKNNDKGDVESKKHRTRDDGDLRGLDDLLLNDNAPEPEERDGEIMQLLSDIGVEYTHRNEDLIVGSVVEARRFETTMKKHKEAKAKAEAKPKQAKAEPTANTESAGIWPPPRSRYQRLTPEQRLRARQISIIELGYISRADQLPNFLQTFMKWPEEHQLDFLARLDEHHRSRGRK